jgi:hypothetical protein
MVLLVLLGACGYGEVGPGDAAGIAVGDAVNHSVAAGASTVDFAELAPFAWDRVHFFGPYVDQGAVDMTLGFHWPDFGKTSMGSEGEVLVIFVCGRHVAHWYVDSTGRTDYDPLAGSYDRSQARFRVVPNKDAPDVLTLEK